MTTRLIDTDVYSYITSSNPKRGLPYQPHLRGCVIALSFITVGEQYAGYLKQISKGKWNRQHLQKLESRLRQVVIIPYDLEICKEFGSIRASLTRTIPINDLWIAACAKRHGLALVTNNHRDFEAIPGLQIISEAPGSKSTSAPV